MKVFVSFFQMRLGLLHVEDSGGVLPGRFLQRTVFNVCAVNILLQCVSAFCAFVFFFVRCRRRTVKHLWIENLLQTLSDTVSFSTLAFLLLSGLRDECLYSCVVAAGVLNQDLSSCSCNEFILYMKVFSGSKIRAALWLSWTPSRSVWLCDFIPCSPELLPLCPRCKAGLAKARQGAQNERKTQQQDSWSFQYTA